MSPTSDPVIIIDLPTIEGSNPASLEKKSPDPEYTIPSEYSLSQNYPNPFNPITKMNYALPKRSRVIISIYNVLGQEVTTLLHKEQDYGYHTVTWNGTDRIGKQVASGVYFARLTTENFSQTKKSKADNKSFSEKNY